MKEVIDLLKRYTNGKQNTDKVEISVLQLNRVIKALEQESILDKIRAEIEHLNYLNIEDGSDGYDKYVDQYDVMKLLDRYKEGAE